MKKWILPVSLFILFHWSNTALAITSDGPYSGRIIDADTGQPIPGVVIVGVWFMKMPTPAGAVGEFYDAREVVTDADGRFTIPSLTGVSVKGNFFLDKMGFVIFKEGYQHLGFAPWISLKVDIIKDQITWDGDAPTIRLKKWTIEQRRKRFGSYTIVMVPDNKKELLIEEVNKEMLEIGQPLWRRKSNVK